MNKNIVQQVCIKYYISSPASLFPFIVTYILNTEAAVSSKKVRNLLL